MIDKYIYLFLIMYNVKIYRRSSMGIDIFKLIVSVEVLKECLFCKGCLYFGLKK